MWYFPTRIRTRTKVDNRTDLHFPTISFYRLLSFGPRPSVKCLDVYWSISLQIIVVSTPHRAMATPIIPLRTVLTRACYASGIRPITRGLTTLAPGAHMHRTPLTPYFAYSHRFHPAARSTTFFSPSFRQLSTAALDASAAAGSSASASSTAPPPPTTSAAIPRSLPNWLFGCSALVFGIVVIGGLTRLTESGLSITEWNPITGILPPLSDADWQVEWEKYRVSPEGIM